MLFRSYNELNSWKSQPWASEPQGGSEWLLLPKRDPNRYIVLEEKHFREKKLSEQQKVLEEHYPAYRDVKTVELMTAVLLYDLTHKERLLPLTYLRCHEPNSSSERVGVGGFDSGGLGIGNTSGDSTGDNLGRALARKL